MKTQLLVLLCVALISVVKCQSTVRVSTPWVPFTLVSKNVIKPQKFTKAIKDKVTPTIALIKMRKFVVCDSNDKCRFVES